MNMKKSKLNVQMKKKLLNGADDPENVEMTHKFKNEVVSEFQSCKSPMIRQMAFKTPNFVNSFSNRWVN